MVFIEFEWKLKVIAIINQRIKFIIIFSFAITKAKSTTQPCRARAFVWEMSDDEFLEESSMNL